MELKSVCILTGIINARSLEAANGAVGTLIDLKV